MATKIAGLAGFIIAVSLFTTVTLADERIGRYQAVPLMDRTDVLSQDVMILDTQTGAVYHWIRSFGTKENPGFHMIVFEGNLTPGTKPGEIVARYGAGLPVIQFAPSVQRDPLGILKPK